MTSTEEFAAAAQVHFATLLLQGLITEAQYNACAAGVRADTQN